jgi:phosphate transport system ATP-binding protein
MTEREAPADTKYIEVGALNVFYGNFHAVKDVDLRIPQNRITAMIGPSGCGKSTVLRSLNRMNDLLPEARVSGSIRYRGTEINGPGIDPVQLRRQIGMVFQKPNPFPKSIYENVAWGARLNGHKGHMDDHVEKCLRQAALWDEVRDKLKQNAFSLSGGQQQRLCIARTLAVEPDVILMDEPASALDPIATSRIEELIITLKQDYTIVIVTHNMGQASRISDFTAFFMVDSGRTGYLEEFSSTEEIFIRPKNKKTEDYISGRFG